MQTRLEHLQEQAAQRRIQLDSDLKNLLGQRISNIEHVTGDSDANEAIVITTEAGAIVRVGTSEWLHVEVTSQ